MNPPPLFFFILTFFFFTTFSDLTTDRTALLSLRSAVGGRSLLWNISSLTPCSWSGVVCSTSTSPSLTELHLPGAGLSGPIPPNTIGNLTSLNTLSLRYNSLTGPLPSDISSLTSLRNLYIQHNSFSGPIPDSLSSLTSLVRLNLADNNFSGPIPASLNNLTRLATLYLQDNRLTGSIPDLDLPSLVQFNVSNNMLTGSVPSRIPIMPPSAYSGNSLCGAPLVSCNGTGNGGGGNLSGGAIAGIVVGSVVGFLLIVIVLLFCCRRKKNSSAVGGKYDGVVMSKGVDVETPGEKSGVESRNRERDSLSTVLEKGESNVGGGGGGGVGGGGGKSLVFCRKLGGGKSFDLEDLLKASAEVLGKGTFGTAYKAALEMGFVMAVKRLKDVSVPEKEFREKIEAVGKMDHENLVPLWAYYHSRDEKLLVFDYMPMGSLSALLHGNRGAGRTPLNFETRSGIALGAARGITYLHAQGPTVSHGNIKSSNVLLTKSYEARVSDFGIAQLIGPSSTPNRATGYKAPEVTDGRKVSQKADVYSFGVMLLELLTGKAPTHAVLNEEGVDLPRWVQSVVREEWTAEVFDLELLRYQNVEEDMVQLLQLAIDCSDQYPDKRPSMAEVTNRIEELCRSSFQQEHDQHSDIHHDQEEERDHTDNSGTPPPSAAD